MTLVDSSPTLPTSGTVTDAGCGNCTVATTATGIQATIQGETQMMFSTLSSVEK